MEHRSLDGEPATSGVPEPVPDPAGETRVFRVPRSGRIAACVLYFLFVVALEFLVIMSFMSKRLWLDARLFSDVGYTLPLLGWLLLALAAGVILVRTLSSRLVVGPDRLRIRTALARSADVSWERIGQIVAVGRLERALTASPRTEPAQETAVQHLLVLDPAGERLANIPGSMYSADAQRYLLEAAERHDIDVRRVPQATARQVLAAHPASLRWYEAWPGAVAALVVAFYLAHYLSFLLNWGL